MQAFLGVLFHSIGGMAAGSFYMPYTKVKKWEWESYWIVGGLFSWLIIPPIASWITVPDFVELLSSGDFNTLLITYAMGLIWGIGGLSFGLGIRYLGLSLGNSVALGFSAAFGALVPTIYYNIKPIVGKVSFTDMINSTGGIVVLLGILLCLIGIGVAGKAGMMKENELSNPEQTNTAVEFNLKKGLLIAALSGILSSFFSFGIETGKPLAEAVVKAGFDPLYQNNISFIVILWGGLTTNFIWTTILSIKNKSYKDFSDKSSPRLNNVLLSAAAGTIWYLQFFFYGMGESKLGNGASSWILHMSVIILTGNLWGLYRREWSEVSTKTKWTVAYGIGIITLSIVLVGIGNSI